MEVFLANMANEIVLQNCPLTARPFSGNGVKSRHIEAMHTVELGGDSPTTQGCPAKSPEQLGY